MLVVVVVEGSWKVLWFKQVGAAGGLGGGDSDDETWNAPGACPLPSSC